MTLQPFVDVTIGALEQRKVFALRQDLVRNASGEKSLMVDRLFAPDWVNVVALTDDDELLLVRQWRFGVNGFTLELPSGVLERGEDPVVGGLRELREETGFTPTVRDHVVVLGAVQTNAAFMNNQCHCVFVPRVICTHPLDLDEHEEIELVRVPRVDVEGLVRSGAINGALGLVALHLWHLHTTAR